MYIELIVSWLVITICAIIMLVQLCRYINRENKSIKDLKLKQLLKSKLCVYIPFAFLVVCEVSSTYVAIFQSEDINSLLYPLVFGTPMLVFYCLITNWNIEIQETGFIYTNYFGLKKFYLYKDVYSKSDQHGWDIFNKNKKIVRVTFLIYNYKVLLNLIKKHGKAI